MAVRLRSEDAVLAPVRLDAGDGDPATPLTDFLYEAASLLSLARAQALSRGDPAAAERIELLRGLVSDEQAYCDNLRLGLPPVPAPVSEEWLPGRPGDDVLAALELDDAHHHQLERIAGVTA